MEALLTVKGAMEGDWTLEPRILYFMNERIRVETDKESILQMKQKERQMIGMILGPIGLSIIIIDSSTMFTMLILYVILYGFNPSDSFLELVARSIGFGILALSIKLFFFTPYIIR